MSTPRTKRQFAGASADPSQRQITSFFNPSAASSSSPKPELPASVEANLLTVGMRVRKSVPEGYKTVGPSAFKLWTDNSPLPTPSTGSRRGGTASSRELLPFCGINKVGGLATQPEFADEVPELDAMPELTMSQESADSVDEVYEPSRKRLFDDDDDDEREALGPAEMSNARVLAVPRSRAKKTSGLKTLEQENMALDDDFEDAEFLVYGDGSEMAN